MSLQEHYKKGITKTQIGTLKYGCPRYQDISGHFKTFQDIIGHYRSLGHGFQTLEYLTHQISGHHPNSIAFFKPVWQVLFLLRYFFIFSDGFGHARGH